jgi:tetratricopeptide (TPR) repeat protein
VTKKLQPFSCGDGVVEKQWSVLMNKIYSGLLIILIFPTMSALGQPTEGKPPLFLQASAQALSQGDVVKAKNILLTERDRNPQAKGVDFGLAIVAFSKGDRAEAAGLLQKSITAGEMLGDSHNLLGVINIQDGKKSEAISEFQAAMEASPKDPQPCLNLAEAYRADNEPKKAYAPLEKAISLTPGNSGLYEFKLRLAKIDAGDLADVAQATEAKIKEKGNDLSMDWVMTAAALSLRKGRTKDAVVLLEQARRAMPADAFHNTMEDHAFKFFATEAEMAPFYSTTAAAK